MNKERNARLIEMSHIMKTGEEDSNITTLQKIADEIFYMLLALLPTAMIINLKFEDKTISDARFGLVSLLKEKTMEKVLSNMDNINSVGNLAFPIELMEYIKEARRKKSAREKRHNRHTKRCKNLGAFLLQIGKEKPILIRLCFYKDAMILIPIPQKQ